MENGGLVVLLTDFDQPAVENGDEPMASANLMTLKALIAKSEGATEPEKANVTAAEPQGTATAEEGEEQ